MLDLTTTITMTTAGSDAQRRKSGQQKVGDIRTTVVLSTEH